MCSRRIKRRRINLRKILEGCDSLDIVGPGGVFFGPSTKSYTSTYIQLKLLQKKIYQFHGIWLRRRMWLPATVHWGAEAVFFSVKKNLFILKHISSWIFGKKIPYIRLRRRMWLCGYRWATAHWGAEAGVGGISGLALI